MAAPWWPKEDRAVSDRTGVNGGPRAVPSPTRARPWGVGFGCESQACHVQCGGGGSSPPGGSHPREPRGRPKPQGGAVWEEEALGLGPLQEPVSCCPSCVACPARGAPHGTARGAITSAAAQLTLPLSTISFCRLVDVVTRNRMACQGQDSFSLRVALPGTQPPGGPSWLLTFIRSVQELRILGEQEEVLGRETDQQCGPRSHGGHREAWQASTGQPQGMR